MTYTLMHKNREVAAIEIDEATTVILNIRKVFLPEHLPVGVGFKDGRADRAALNDWWVGRAIPASRSGLREALELIWIRSAQQLLTKCLGLSLSDQYWVCPKNQDLEWPDVNFFENDFSDDVGNALFGRAPGEGGLNRMSPDNTSDGGLKKKWVIAGGKRVLLKGGSAPYYQEPVNELLATAVYKRLGIPHVPYTLTWDGNYPLSACEDFITPQTELISAWRIYTTQKKQNHFSDYQHIIRCYESLRIPGARESLDRMITADYIVVNTDRHFNNIGALRNAETLEWLGPAPLFDTGTSMWHNQLAEEIHPDYKVASKPFKSNHGDQIRLVSSFDWLDINALYGIDEEYAELLRGSASINEERRDKLCYALRTRINLLAEVVEEPENK
jgi:hypothetical protein